MTYVIFNWFLYSLGEIARNDCLEIAPLDMGHRLKLLNKRLILKYSEKWPLTRYHLLSGIVSVIYWKIEWDLGVQFLSHSVDGKSTQGLPNWCARHSSQVMERACAGSVRIVRTQIDVTWTVWALSTYCLYWQIHEHLSDCLHYDWCVFILVLYVFTK